RSVLLDPVSGVIALIVGAAGALLSMVIVKPTEAELVLRAASVAVAVKLCVPLPSVLVLLDVQLPLASASAVATAVVPLPSKIFSVLPAWAVPDRVSCVALVGSSLLLDPVSGTIALIVGAFGALRSAVTAKADEAEPVLPAKSVAVAV